MIELRGDANGRASYSKREDRRSRSRRQCADQARSIEMPNEVRPPTSGRNDDELRPLSLTRLLGCPGPNECS